MPGCVLRIGGKFAAKELLMAMPLPNVVHCEDGCIVAIVSDDENTNLTAQIAAAESLLAKYGESLCKAIACYTLNVELDFGVWLTGTFVQSLRFPPELMTAASQLGIVVCVSLYESEKDEA